MQFRQNLRIELLCIESFMRMRMMDRVFVSESWIHGIVNRGWCCLCDFMTSRHDPRSVNVNSHRSDPFHSGHLGSVCCVWVPQRAQCDALQSVHFSRSDVLSERTLCCSDPSRLPNWFRPCRVTIPLGSHGNVHDRARIKVQSFVEVQLKIKSGSTFAFEFKHSFVSKWNSGSMGMVCTESVSAQLHIQTRLEVPLRVPCTVS